MATDNIRIQPYLPPTLYQRLENHKEHTGRSISQIVISALENYLDRTDPESDRPSAPIATPTDRYSLGGIITRIDELESIYQDQNNLSMGLLGECTFLIQQFKELREYLAIPPGSLPSDEPQEGVELPSESPEFPSKSLDEFKGELPIIKFLEANGNSPQESPQELPSESPAKETPQIEDKPQSKVRQPLYLGKGLPYTLAKDNLSYLTNLEGLCPVAANDEQFCQRMIITASTLQKKKRLSPLQQAKWSLRKETQSIFWIWDKSINYWVGRPSCEWDEIDWSKS